MLQIARIKLVIDIHHIIIGIQMHNQVFYGRVKEGLLNWLSLLAVSSKA